MSYPIRIPRDPFDVALFLDTLQRHVRGWHRKRYSAGVGGHRGDGTFDLTIFPVNQPKQAIVVGDPVAPVMITGRIWIEDMTIDDRGRFRIKWETESGYGNPALAGDEVGQPAITFQI